MLSYLAFSFWKVAFFLLTFSSNQWSSWKGVHILAFGWGLLVDLQSSFQMDTLLHISGGEAEMPAPVLLDQQWTQFSVTKLLFDNTLK